jgi:hypothetical protein
MMLAPTPARDGCGHRLPPARCCWLHCSAPGRPSCSWPGCWARQERPPGAPAWASLRSTGPVAAPLTQPLRRPGGADVGPVQPAADRHQGGHLGRRPGAAPPPTLMAAAPPACSPPPWRCPAARSARSAAGRRRSAAASLPGATRPARRGLHLFPPTPSRRPRRRWACCCTCWPSASCPSRGTPSCRSSTASGCDWIGAVACLCWSCRAQRPAERPPGRLGGVRAARLASPALQVEGSRVSSWAARRRAAGPQLRPGGW